MIYIVFFHMHAKEIFLQTLGNYFYYRLPGLHEDKIKLKYNTSWV
jgi:hypothetical protein